MIVQRWVRWIPWMLAIALTVTIWCFIAPSSVGGQSTYLITTGTSMLPGIQTGDLVILREVDKYQVGDVVAYRDPQVGTILHRIIGHAEGKFLLKGDNNDFVDPYRPDESDIAGQLWIHLPSVGSRFAKMQEPHNAAGIVLVAGLIIVTPARRGGRRVVRRLRGNKLGSNKHMTSTSNGKSPIAFGFVGQAFAVTIGLLAILSLMVAALSFSQPITRETSVATPYEQRGAFSYRAETSGSVYDSGAATTGQPVYRRLADEVAIRFDYELSSELSSALAGTYRLDAIVSQEDGWSRLVPLVPETDFSGNAVAIDGTLDLLAIQSMVDSVRQQTGLADQPQRGYSLSVVPSISVNGLLGESAVQDTFSPELAFTVEPLVMRLGGQAGTGETDPLSPSVSGSIPQIRMVSNQISLPVLDVNVSTARQLARYGIGLSLLGGLILLTLAWHASRIDEPSRIRTRYGTMLIALRGSDLGASGRVVDVASIDDLIKVAERESRMVLHQEHGAIHNYFVQDVDVTYRYQTSAPPTINTQPNTESV